MGEWFCLSAGLGLLLGVEKKLPATGKALGKAFREVLAECLEIMVGILVLVFFTKGLCRFGFLASSGYEVRVFLPLLLAFLWGKIRLRGQAFFLTLFCFAVFFERVLTELSAGVFCGWILRAVFTLGVFEILFLGMRMRFLCEPLSPSLKGLPVYFFTGAILGMILLAVFL